MRLIELNLERYGPFTGRTLRFREDSPLHIVLGRNEAGKSSSLAAITDLFYEIEGRTAYNFLHDAKDLRIGATVQSKDGTLLTFRRRKGNKNTLLGANDQPLSDQLLAPFLSGVSRSVFSRAFGLNSAQLREGGNEMLATGGEVGASLLAAASGLSGLTKIREALESDADLIFGPRAKKSRTFDIALSRYEEARHSIHVRELKASDWKAVNDAIDSASSRLAQIKSLRSELEIERSRLSRISSAAPHLRLVDRALERLSLLGDLPSLPAGFSVRLRTALQEQSTAAEELKRSQDEEDAATRHLDSIVVNRAVLDCAADIELLFSQTAADANNRRDIPRIQSDMDESNRKLTELAHRLGLPGRAALEEQRPSDAGLATVRDLIRDGRTLHSDLQAAQKRLAAETKSLETIQFQLTARGEVPDPQPLEARFKLLSPELKRIERLSGIASDVRAEVRDLAESALRLNPPVHDLDAISYAPIPSPQTISRFRAQFDALESELSHAEIALSETRAHGVQLESALLGLSSAGPVPSVELIAAKRKQRDDEWTSLRTALFAPSGTQSPLALAGTVTAFERLSAEADSLADRAAGEASRVEAYALKSNDLTSAGLRAAAFEDKLQNLHVRRDDLARDWSAGWTAVSVDPLPPVEMSAWVTSLDALLVRRKKLKTLEDELAELRSLESILLPKLLDIAGEREGTIESLSSEIHSRLSNMSQLWHAAQALDSKHRDAIARVQLAQDEAAQKSQELDLWRTRWAAVAPPLAIPANASPDAADAVLKAWAEVPALVRERDKSARRVIGMERDVEAFRQSVRHLADALAPDLAAASPADAAQRLQKLLTAERSAESNAVEARNRLAAAVERKLQSSSSAAAKQRALDELALAVPPGLDLSEFAVKLESRENIAAELDRHRADLLFHAGGLSEDAVRDALATFDSDRAAARIAEIESEQQELNEEALQVHTARADREKECKAMEFGVGAEFAVQQRKGAEVELLDAARDWAVLKIAAAMLGKIVINQRSAHQDPLIARASAIFSAVTGGAFSSLIQDFDADDIPRIVGRRPSGETVPVPGMSEGTRDQLFFALRLAYIEDYSAKSEPIPFICDDIFTTFDDARTSHAVAALAATGTAAQTILFTHHRHVADIAASQLGRALDLIELG
jgi:uncharacterized protein YhaN